MVKALFIEAKKKMAERVEVDVNLLKSLPSEVTLAYSIQYRYAAEAIRKELGKLGKKVREFVQVLGCTQLKSKYPLILIGSGKFHALNLALQNKEVYLYNSGVIENINKKYEKELKELAEKKKNNINRFLQAESIGIIVSTKPGQNKSKLAEELKARIEKKYPEKKVYLFISNNINLGELENFQIGVWINSACPGLVNDTGKIINSDDIISFLETINKK